MTSGSPAATYDTRPFSAVDGPARGAGARARGGPIAVLRFFVVKFRHLLGHFVKRRWCLGRSCLSWWRSRRGKKARRSYTRSRGSGAYLAQEMHDRFAIYSQPGPTQVYSATLPAGTGPEGFLDISDSQVGVTAAIRNFWQTWPNALQATQDDRLVMYMFSPWARDGYFDWSNGSVYTPTDTGLYWIDDMQHVTKTYWLNAHGSVSSAELERLNQLFQKHPVAVIPMEWYKETAVTLDMDGLIPRSDNVVSGAADIWFYNEAGNINSHFYHFGYDNYMADEGRRKGNTTGGWPHSSAWFIASENPVDYYTSEARVFGDLNARPQNLAGYDYEDDRINNLVPLDVDPYDTMSWRYWKHNFAYPKLVAPYLEGTYWSGYNIRDFEHLWMYETEEFYNLSADRRIYDWYKFIGEFMKSYVLGSENCPYDISDEGTTHATRAEGHVLNTLLQAYRVVGDPTYLDAAKLFVSDLKKNQTKYGNQKTSVFLDSPFQTAYLARGVINFLELVKDYDKAAYLEGFSYLEGLIEWNYYYGTYEYFLETDNTVSYTHLRAHETVLDLVCRLLLEKKNDQYPISTTTETLPLSPY